MWCLLPDLGKTGFGCDSTKSYYGMWVSNGGLAPPAKGKRGRQEFYAYPGNGFYPANRFHGNGWSVYPGTALPKGQDVEVKVYELTQRPENAPTAATLAKAAKEVKVDYTKRNGDQGGWEGGWLVFEPQVTVEPGKIVWVSMKCGAVRISYVVEFIDGQF